MLESKVPTSSDPVHTGAIEGSLDFVREQVRPRNATSGSSNPFDTTNWDLWAPGSAGDPRGFSNATGANPEVVNEAGAPSLKDPPTTDFSESQDLLDTAAYNKSEPIPEELTRRIHG